MDLKKAVNPLPTQNSKLSNDRVMIIYTFKIIYI